MTAVNATPGLPAPPNPPGPVTPHLNAEEEQIVAYLRDERPDLLGSYLGRLGRGRRLILHRLLQAMIREDVAGVAGRVAWEDDGRALRVALGDGRAIRARVGRRGAFGRLEFEGDVTLDDGGQPVPIEQPRRLLELASGSTGDAAPAPFARELENSAANATLALVAADRRRAELSAEARGAATAIDWVERQLRADPEFNPLVFFEQWVIDGHPAHPGAKLRLGMGPADVIRYAPEWGARPGLALVAVAREACRVASTGPEGPREILLREHPEARPVVEGHLSRSGLRPGDFELIPVHPWQLEHTIPRLHADGIARGEVVPIPGAIIPAAALVSVRSMATIGPRGVARHHVKAALAVQMTNAVRTVSPQAAENGPMLTRILDDLQAREGRFGGRFAALREDVGVYYVPTDPGLDPEERATQARHLAAILREAPEDHAERGEVALPAAALAVLDAYAAVSVPGFLTLMARFGVALEGHLQNSVAVIRLADGAPARMLVHDLGGVRVLPDRLARHGVAADFRPGSATVAEGEDDLRDKVYYAFIQNHLGELVAAIARHYALDEPPLWRPIASACRATFRELRRDAAIASQASADEAALFGPTLRLKALTQMRLRGEVTSYRFAEVPNPLADAPGVV